MKKIDSRIVWGIVLITGGVLFLLQSLGLLAVWPLLWSFLLGAAGLAFLFLFLTDYRANLWAAIPGLFLLGLATMNSLGRWFPWFGRTWGSALFFGAIGLVFWAIYFTNREHWWTIIPGGIFLTLALIAGLSFRPFVRRMGAGGVFFLGLGLTFALLSFLSTSEKQMKWALIPAAILLVIGLLIMAAAKAAFYIWPIILILGGCYLLFHTFRPR